jgi:hypothetical protein
MGGAKQLIAWCLTIPLVPLDFLQWVNGLQASLNFPKLWLQLGPSILTQGAAPNG